MPTAANNRGAGGPRAREAASTIPVYERQPIAARRASGCEIFLLDGRRMLDFYGGDAVAALGYGHPRLTEAIKTQSQRLVYQDHSVGLEVRAAAAEKLVAVAPDSLTRTMLVGGGAEANENALRIAFMATGRRKVLAVTHGYHGRSAAAAAVSWHARASWYGFPDLPFEVDFIPRNDVDAAMRMVDNSIAAVIFEPVQGAAGSFDLSPDFVEALRNATRSCAALLIADEVQCGMGRCGRFFAIEVYGIEPDIVTCGEALGGGVPVGAVLINEDLARLLSPGDLDAKCGGGPLAAAAVLAVIEAIEVEDLLQNVRSREADIREHCRVGPVVSIQGIGLMLGFVCDRPAKEVQRALLDHDIMTGISDDPEVLKILPPLIVQRMHVEHLADTLRHLVPGR